MVLVSACFRCISVKVCNKVQNDPDKMKSVDVPLNCSLTMMILEDSK